MIGHGSRLLFEGSNRHARIPFKPVLHTQEIVGGEDARTESAPSLATCVMSTTLQALMADRFAKICSAQLYSHQPMESGAIGT
ncbi:MAG: hypothetical protein LZF60_160170 [Nitrospira sp.]|nr:MAG: hypothetical protein LZF60_160170 [Nitrospira sp.]